MNIDPRLNPADRLVSCAAWLGIACLGQLNAVARAEEPDPASRVARVSYIKGDVYTQTVDDDDWSDARINQPLTSGDQLWTDKSGRAELQMGGTTLQVDADTQLQLLELSDEVAQIRVTQGLVNVRVRNLSKRDTVELDTPHAAVSVMETGTYRIEVADQDNVTVVKVRAGSVDVAGEQQNHTVRAYEQLVLHGTPESAELDSLKDMDEFDRWAAERNQRAERVVSSQYVGPGVIGYEDLDGYGDWRWYGDYGYVWMPTRIVTGWAPYRYGSWSWVSPWGWTWIDDAPWGFAPFHYGRWTTIGSRWCWVPGPRTMRAVYAPALVAWIGTPGLSVSVRVGTQPVGWIPLGPREIYRPVYRSSHNYVVNVNVSNSRLNHDDFERGYRRQPHEVIYANRYAASVVHADTLRSARPVKDQLIHSPDRDLQPLITTPVTRPERGEQAMHPRTTPPPITPNTREVLARRQPGQPAFTDGDVARSRGVRVIEPPAVGRNSGNSGIRPEFSDNGTARRDNEYPRDIRTVYRSPAPANRDIPAWNSRSVTTAPSAGTDSSRDQPDVWPRGRNTTATPPVSSPREVSPRRETPAASEPRVRNYSWSDETRSSNRQNNRTVNPEADAMPERGRSVTIPRMPIQRGEQTAPASNDSSASNSNSDRRRDDQNGTGQQRGFRGESR